jgi:hypothetical protein
VVFQPVFCKFDNELKGLLVEIDPSIEGVWIYGVD